MYAAKVARLSKHSVTKHFDAYQDVAWDDPENRLDPRDPRWERPESDPLGGTAWYRAQPQATRAQLGLHLVAQQMMVGLQFENILSRGLLELAMLLPAGAPELRYAYHEVIEESQHSLMFQEFIHRSGLPVRGLTGLEAFGARFIPGLARSFPELFFLFVLGGEEPIDYTQRELLKGDRELHPLARRIMRIHVIEEARHVCFARTYLEEHVPKLSAPRMLHLRVRAPIIFSVMAKQMLEPPRDIVAHYAIPRAVIREAYTNNVAHKAALMDGLANVRKLCADLKIATPRSIRLWKWLGIWPSDQNARALSKHVVLPGT